MLTLRAEFHVHTLLSPCAEVEMIPPLIVSEAIAHGIGLIAVTDHNVSANVTAVQKAAAGSDLVVLPGMELQTLEEVHVLCLFDTLEQLEAWQQQVDAALPGLENNPDYFGEQFVVDETGEFIRREDRLLLTSANITIEAAFEGVNALGGLAIPAHVDRTSFGLIANLGLVPTGLKVEALEISRHIQANQAAVRFPQIAGYPLIQSGDVHRLDEFLGVNKFEIESATLAELRMAFRQEGGRSFAVCQKDTHQGVTTF